MPDFNAETATYSYWLAKIKAALTVGSNFGRQAKGRPVEWADYQTFLGDVGLMNTASDKLVTVVRGEHMERNNCAWTSTLRVRGIYKTKKDGPRTEALTSVLASNSIRQLPTKREFTLSTRGAALGLTVTLADVKNFNSTVKIWYGMWVRCTYKHSKAYARYKEREPEARWKVFQNFLEDMGERPEGLSIERVDNNRGYCKDNCCWATAEQQANNTSRSVRIRLPNGEVVTRKQLEALPECEVTATTYEKRVARGVSHREALSSEFRLESSSGATREGLWLFAGELKSLAEIADILKTSKGSIKARLRDARASARKLSLPEPKQGEAFPLSAAAFRKPEAQIHREWVKHKRQ